MQVLTDPTEISNALFTNGATVIEPEALSRMKRCVALTEGGIGILLFAGTRNDHVYQCAIFKHPGSKGAQMKAFTNEAFRYAFLNSNAYVVRGTVNKSNAQMIAFASQINGIYVKSQDANTYTYQITLASLAKHYGPQTVIDALNAAGRTAKVVKLWTAWEASR